MNARQPEKHSPWNPLRLWHQLRWRWKVTLMGAAMATFAACLWTIPAAYYAFKGGYITHGAIHTATSIIGVVVMTGIMHLLGIRQERELNATD